MIYGANVGKKRGNNNIDTTLYINIASNKKKKGNDLSGVVCREKKEKHEEGWVGRSNRKGEMGKDGSHFFRCYGGVGKADRY